MQDKTDMRKGAFHACWQTTHNVRHPHFLVPLPFFSFLNCTVTVALSVSRTQRAVRFARGFHDAVLLRVSANMAALIARRGKSEVTENS